MKTYSSDKRIQAYVVGLALGDGNLSNPNCRAVRLRITCDKKYPKLIEHIEHCIHVLLPENKVSRIKKKKNAVDISCYSNYWEHILGWKAKNGSKFKQKVTIPQWIMEKEVLLKECLRGLFQTDGSIYFDRGYKMINFVSEIPTLAQGVYTAVKNLGYKSSVQRFVTKSNREKYTIRIASKSEDFLKDLRLWKE